MFIRIRVCSDIFKVYSDVVCEEDWSVKECSKALHYQPALEIHQQGKRIPLIDYIYEVGQTVLTDPLEKHKWPSVYRKLLQHTHLMVDQMHQSALSRGLIQGTQDYLESAGKYTSQLGDGIFSELDENLTDVGDQMNHQMLRNGLAGRLSHTVQRGARVFWDIAKEKVW